MPRSQLTPLSSPTAAWFASTLGAPTDVQARGWGPIAAGAHTLMAAPTGSGKTLAAFLVCLDRMLQEALPAVQERCRLLYISPLKALAVDIDRNLRAPLHGITLAARHAGVECPTLAVGLRSGDTPADERRAMVRRPPDILITTPESLFLLLTSAARSVLTSVRWVIVDEIHALAGRKRGAHVAVSLERLAELGPNDPQRIGLSATQRPLDRVARFLGGVGRDVCVVDANRARSIDLRVEASADDMRSPAIPVTSRGADATPDGEAVTPRRASMWDLIHPRLLALIRSHRSTIVFANSRRVAERVATRLNELAGEDLVRTHHGSMAREQRMEVENALKAGRLAGLVATSSLELGIDMGAVDLVVQLGSPGSVASAIQRIGRSGHSVNAVSRGTIVPRHRGELLEIAAITERVPVGVVEEIGALSNPLDILAQHIVAACALETWPRARLATVIRRADPFRDLGDRALTATIEMLTGRYPSDEFAELRPRIVWDRIEDTLRGRRGAQRLAVTSGGTIPDRGLYTVNILDDGRRVGELDEEMVYELRASQTFVLGATTWRVAEITPSQVLVTPAPGEPGTPAFWHGDGVGRPSELGRALGQLTRELSEVDEATAITRLRERHSFDVRAARNLLAYLADERGHTGTLPDDRTVVVERFRDELGDWRVCVLSCMGERVHAPWALTVAGRLRERLGLDVEEMHGDDGFALRIADRDDTPSLDELLIDPETVRDEVIAQLHESALFAARFRENAARALLLPRRRPGLRTPLWMQRRRAFDLLRVAANHPDFPVIAETYRECLNDVFEVDALVALMRAIRSRDVRVVEVTTERPSPFAASLVFDYVAQYMYEGDQPLAERRAQALTLDRELLAELLGTDDLGDLLVPGVVGDVERELQHLPQDRHPRDVDEALDVLVQLGDLSDGEAEARGISGVWLQRLDESGRALPIKIAGERRWIAAEDGASYRDVFGVALRAGPAIAPGPVSDLSALVRRWCRTHGPTTDRILADRWGVPPALIGTELAALAADRRLLTGVAAATMADVEYWHPDVLARVRRRSLARLRREVEPVPPVQLARFLPAWHGIGSSARGPDRLLEVIDQLEGVALPASMVERDILARRVSRYDPSHLDALFADGAVVWLGCGALGANDGRVTLCRRERASAIADPAFVDDPLADALRQHLGRRGASFLSDLVALTAGLGDREAILATLWRMAWAGEVTNDRIAVLRALGSRFGRPSGMVTHRVPPRFAGRWSLVADLGSDLSHPTRRLSAQAQTLLDRHGVVTREAVGAESVAGGWAALYPVLRHMEETGRIRRGYFVEGLGGSQFALPGAVDKLRAEASLPRIVALAAVDPANAFGVTVPWPAGSGRFARQAGAFVVLDGGELRLYLERGGRSMLTQPGVTPAHVAALVGAVRSQRWEITHIDGERAATNPFARALCDAGFERSLKGLVRWSRRGLLHA